jgi:hypothetical protein
MSDPAANFLPPAQQPTEPQPQPRAVAPPPVHYKSHRLLNLVFLAIFVVTIVADIYIVYLVVNLVILSYSGGNDPTSINGLDFPIAIFIDIVVGAPAAVITYLAFFGYKKTKPQRTQAASNRLST